MDLPNGNARLDPGSDTLDHLRDYQRTGLMAVGAIATISFISTSALVLFLTYKLLACQIRAWHRARQDHQMATDLSLGLPESHYPTRGPTLLSKEPGAQADPVAKRPQEEKRRNPFPILIYNVLLAEMQTSLGYALNLSWVAKNGIFVRTSTCWAQGCMNNLGVLTSSIFFMSISASTYLAVVWGWRPPQRGLYIWIACCWVVALVLTFGGVIATDNGRSEGGWFVRANTWCWINAKYAPARLWAAWGWILISIPVTIILYSLVFWNLYRHNRSCRYLPYSTPGDGRNQPSGHHPAFLVYPFIYIACTSPLAIARLTTICGGSIGDGFYYVAGSVLSSNGVLNTLLWSATMLVSTPEDIRDTGLDKFVFMRTPEWRRYGNMVWIQGLSSKPSNDGAAGTGWWWWRIGGQVRWKSEDGIRRGASQESLRGNTINVQDNSIHMDIVTTVVVEEVENDRRHVANSTDTCGSETGGDLEESGGSKLTQDYTL